MIDGHRVTQDHHLPDVDMTMTTIADHRPNEAPTVICLVAHVAVAHHPSNVRAAVHLHHGAGGAMHHNLVVHRHLADAETPAVQSILRVPATEATIAGAKPLLLANAARRLRSANAADHAHHQIAASLRHRSATVELRHPQLVHPPPSRHSLPQRRRRKMLLSRRTTSCPPIAARRTSV